MWIARTTDRKPPMSIIALGARRKSLSVRFSAARESVLLRVAMDTPTYSVANVNTRRAWSVEHRQKKLSLVHSDTMGITARLVDGRKSRSNARRAKNGKSYFVTLKRRRQW